MPLLKPNHNIVSIATLPDGGELKKAMPHTPWLLQKALNMSSNYYSVYAAWNKVNYSYLFMKPNGADLQKIIDMAEKGQLKAIIGDVVEGYGEGAEERLRGAMETVKNGGSKSGGKVVIKMTA